MTGRPRKPRARKAADPTKFPPCARCGECYPVAARWPEGGICGYCYRAARRTSGTCAMCGHKGVLPGADGSGRPTCRTCSGIDVPVECRRCGAEDDLYRKDTCWRCALADDVTALLANADGVITHSLRPVAKALSEMPRANSGITWLRNPKARSLLRSLATGEIELSHAGLDAQPASRTVEYVRDLLVEHGALEGRDRHIATYLRWLDTCLARIDDEEPRRLIETFARWHQLRRLRDEATKGGVKPATFLRAKQSTTVALDFLEWLARRGRTLGGLTQRDLDAWFAGGPTTRVHAKPFIYWAVRTRRIRGIEVPGAQPRSHPAIGQEERLQALRRLLTDDSVELRVRIAGSLILLFGQPAQRVAQLQTNQVGLDEEAVRIRVAADWLDVPEPFATSLRSYLPERPNMATAANADSVWLFPGAMPGQPLSPNSLVAELRARGVPVLAARTGTWQQLVRQGPPSVLAQALGISPKTAMKHAERAGADWLRYAALRGGAASTV